MKPGKKTVVCAVKKGDRIWKAMPQKRKKKRQDFEV